MTKLAIVMMAAATLLAGASVALGAVGWCGNIWPDSGIVYTSNDDIGVYVQIWKDGCTNASATEACADLEAKLFYRCGGTADAFTEVAMTYNTDVGNNDEFTGVIPSGHGCETVEYYVEVMDLTDSVTCYGQDQGGHDPNFFLPITEVTSQDVTVRFHMCLTSGIETTGDVCITGDGVPLTEWGNGVVMSLTCPTQDPKLYQVDVLFPLGSNPFVLYKFRKDGCDVWEGTGNHTFTIDDSGSFYEIPWTDGWEFITPDCSGCATATENTNWGGIKATYR